MRTSRRCGRIPGATVAAVCDLNEHMAEQAAARFGVPAVVHGPRPDARRGAARTSFTSRRRPASHLAIARKVAERRRPCVRREALLGDAAEAEEMVECATRAGVLFCVGHSSAFDSAYAAAVEASVATACSVTSSTSTR